MKIYKSVTGVFLLLLSACQVSKDTAITRSDFPSQFRNQAAASDTNSVADLPWQSFFTSPDLQQLIDAAILKNYDMQIAIKNIEASDLLFQQIKWNYVPELNLNISSSSNRPSDNSLTGLSIKQFNIGSKHIQDYSVNLALSWEADVWGKIRNQQKSALAVYLQSKEVKKAVQTRIISQISKGFYNLLMLNTQLEIAKKNVQLNDSTLTIIRFQYEAGQVTQLAVQQAEAQRLVAQQFIPEFEQNIIIQENAIRMLTGEFPDKLKLAAKLSTISPSDHMPVGIASAVINRRPDVRLAELLLTISNANVGITKASMYPALRITAGGGVNALKASDWFNIPASLFGIVGGSISQPLLNHKRLKTQYELALIEREQNVMRFRQSVLIAFEEVSDALVKMQKLKKQYEIASKRVDILQKSTADANMLFKNGMANYLEVITAQSNVLQSELDLASLKRTELSASVELYTSLGGGWQ